MKFTPQRVKFLHSMNGVNYSLDFLYFFWRELSTINHCIIPTAIRKSDHGLTVAQKCQMIVPIRSISIRFCFYIQPQSNIMNE